MRVAIFGVGFLGSALQKILSKNFEVLCLTRNPKSREAQVVNVLDQEKVLKVCKLFKPVVIINTISQPSYYKCELDPEESYRSNVLTNRSLLNISSELGAKYVYISSSYIFDGRTGGYTESSSDYSKLVYAMHKVIAEDEVKNTPNSLIIRLETLFGPDPLTGAMRIGSKQLVGVFNVLKESLIRSPISTDDASLIIEQMLFSEVSGTFNVAGRNKFILSDFLLKLAKGKSDVRFFYQSANDWLVRPPKDTSLSLEKIIALGVFPPVYFPDP